MPAATPAAQREKNFFFEEKVYSYPKHKAGLWVKRANGINGGKPVGRRRLCRIATLSQSPAFCSQRPMLEGYQGRSHWLVSAQTGVLSFIM
jgi:hypothetical protein